MQGLAGGLGPPTPLPCICPALAPSVLSSLSKVSSTAATWCCPPECMHPAVRGAATGARCPLCLYGWLCSSVALLVCGFARACGTSGGACTLLCRPHPTIVPQVLGTQFRWCDRHLCSLCSQRSILLCQNGYFRIIRGDDNLNIEAGLDACMLMLACLHACSVPRQGQGLGFGCSFALGGASWCARSQDIFFDESMPCNTCNTLR